MNTPNKPLVVLGVTGCIAAYKACELSRRLIGAGCRVKVIMTENATRFVGPATFRALTDEPVAVSLWDDAEARVHHISLAQEADVMVVAPATANIIAKMAMGRADDLLTTTALATRAPVIVAPAMNVAMWQAEATRANIATLESRGVITVGPDCGELACGDVGEGRLVSVERIVDSVLGALRSSASLAGVNVLVTAGPTREPIDPVRFISNGSSGKTGYAIAAEAQRRGASVTLVSGPTSITPPHGVQTIPVVTAVEMAEVAFSHYADADVVVATAAVSDFRPIRPSDRKIKKDDAELLVSLARNPDILAELGSRKGNRFLVGFAAETTDVIDHAKAKLTAKKLDLVVANDVSADVGFGTDDNVVWFVSATAVQMVDRCSKRRIAETIWDRIAGDANECARIRRNGAPQ
jgi:phosphopantothenoylcysteine decarboxylase/phosphopantothenate--cysteine ligase